MRIVLINVPHPAIGSRIPKEQLPPLGLLSIGGPLIDAGHQVTLIDGEFGPMPCGEIAPGGGPGAGRRAVRTRDRLSSSGDAPGPRSGEERTGFDHVWFQCAC